MGTFYLGRQPILNREKATVAYGLVFHQWDPASDEKQATEKSARLLVNGLMDIGLDEVSGHLPVYVPVTRELLLRDVISEFPPSMLGISIPVNMQVDDELLTVCHSLRQQGYRLQLNGMKEDGACKALLGVADSVKLDIGAPDVEGQVRSARRHGTELVAGKVETRADYERAASLGFDGFQGFFFCHPEVVSGKALPASSLAVMQALQKVMNADAIADVEGVVKHDVTLSYRLLRHINSAAFALRSKVTSVRQALGLLGLANIRQWLALLLLADAGKGLPPELVRVALLRASMLEGIAELHDPQRKSDYYLLGLFSLLDTILGVPMQEALAKLCLPDDIHRGLLERESKYGRLLLLVRSVELEKWELAGELARGLGIDRGDLMGAYARALHWLSENVDLLEPSSD